MEGKYEYKVISGKSGKKPEWATLNEELNALADEGWEVFQSSAAPIDGVNSVHPLVLERGDALGRIWIEKSRHNRVNLQGQRLFKSHLVDSIHNPLHVAHSTFR